MNEQNNTSKGLTHTDMEGKAKMVDVGSKTRQARKAIASGFINMSSETINSIRDNQNKKGDVLAVAQIAGIQAAKMTPTLIPLCHPIPLDMVSVHFELADQGIEARCTVSSEGKTGVEMETLTGVSVSLLTIYDMCKAIDKNMKISEVRLVNKEKRDI
jgi:cyclic pyranopterin phosphate synthase